MGEQRLVGYHANWCLGKWKKTVLLKELGLWDWSDGTRCRSSAEHNRYLADLADEARAGHRRRKRKACAEADNGATDVDGLGCSQHTGPTNGQWDDSDFTADLMCCASRA